MNKDTLIKKLNKIIEPIVADLEYELYFVEYVKESGEYYLRVYIDSPKGISLQDCEKVSRKISEAMDENDPIPDAYYLEVSSPGIERGLYTDEHLKRHMGLDVSIKTSELFEGKKNFKGKLLEFDMDNMTIETEDNNISIPRNIIRSVNLKVEY